MGAEPAACFEGAPIRSPSKTSVEFATGERNGSFILEVDVAFYLACTMPERKRRQPLGARPVEALEFTARRVTGTPRTWYREPASCGSAATGCSAAASTRPSAPCSAVKGESMAPTLVAGSSVLIDRSRTRRRDGQIFVVRTAEGMVVKRAPKSNDDGWQLLSDHPAWEPVAFPEDAVILGRVVWTARALV